MKDRVIVSIDVTTDEWGEMMAVLPEVFMRNAWIEYYNEAEDPEEGHLFNTLCSYCLTGPFDLAGEPHCHEREALGG